MVSPRSIALIQAIEASAASPADSRTSATTGSTSDHAAVGRGLLRAAIGQRRLAERDGALQRAHQLRRKALHPRIGHAGELVRQQLRGRQQIAQIVVDLGDREAERGEPALLMQHRHQVALHVGQFALGDADLVAALARHDDPRRAFRVFVEADQARGQPPHRPHEQIMQRQIDQRRGQHRDRQRDQQQIAREAVHRLAQRQLVDHDLDELRAAGRRARPRGSPGCRSPAWSRTNRRSPTTPSSSRMSMSWSIAAGRSALASSRRCWPILMATARAPMLLEDLPRQRIRDHARGRGIQHQRRGIGRRQPVVEPVHPEIRDRGHVDQHVRDHDQRNGQQQQLAGQAEPARRPSAAACWSADRRLAARSVADTTYLPSLTDPAFARMRSRPATGQITDR